MTASGRVARLLAAVAGLVLILVVLSRGSGPVAPAHAPLPRLSPSPPPAPEPEVAGPLATRDIFRYAEPRPHEVPRGRAPARPPQPGPSASPLALKLVGIVNKGGTQRAVLALSGEVTLAAVGERVGGYTVLSIDADSGVRVRDPDGQEITLPLP